MIEAAKWYRAAAEAGDSEAQFSLGRLYARSDGVPQDIAEAANGPPRRAIPKRKPGWARSMRAANMSDRISLAPHHCSGKRQMRVTCRPSGHLYAQGHLEPPKEGAAINCFRTAAEAGLLEAQLIVAWNYLNGQGVARDSAAAALWFRRAAEQGDAGAQFQLAALYCTGTGVVRNLSEAVKWYRHSAEQGDRYAQYNLAVMLLKGQGTEQNPDEALHWAAPPPSRVWRRHSFNLAISTRQS